NFQFQRLGYFTVDKDSTAQKLVFNRTVGLRDAWEEKGKREENLLIITQKEINKYVKEMKEGHDTMATAILSTIIHNIKSIESYSLIVNTIIKNIKNDNNALMFANMLLYFSDHVNEYHIDEEAISKLYGMSMKSQMSMVRVLGLKNMAKNSTNKIAYKSQFTEMQQTDKNEDVLNLLSELLEE
ncbi:MAG TPA: hypothetical protein VK476_00835, partial [Flavobacterium sp.]|nr:hypothetical protein [Flavobacterium sp.]